jgi:peptidylprolyl isomerase
MRIVVVATVALALALQLGACGGSGDSAATGDTTESIDAPVPAYAGEWTDLKKRAGADADKLLIPKGPSPEDVVIHDVREGTGKPIEPGDTFAARYVSFDYETGEVKETNWGRQPWRLKWKIGELVDGWEPGLKGVKAGGLRELIVPSSLAYESGPVVYLVDVAYLERH